MNIHIIRVGLYRVSIKNLVGWPNLMQPAVAIYRYPSIPIRSHESLFEFASKLGRRNYWPEIIVFCHFKLVYMKKNQQQRFATD